MTRPPMAETFILTTFLVDIQPMTNYNVSPSSAPFPFLELKRGAFTANNSYLSICPSKQGKAKQTNRLCLPSFSRLHLLQKTTSSRVWVGACSCTPLSLCLENTPFLLRGTGTAASCRAVITTVPPMREREVLGTPSSGQTTYDVICRVGLAQTDSSCS